MTELLQIAPEVQQALHESRPVVALETTLIAHGFPPRVGVEVGLASEAAVTLEGAVAATVGVIDGAVVVGLDKTQIERFGEAGAEARKAGPRDLAAFREAQHYRSMQYKWPGQTGQPRGWARRRSDPADPAPPPHFPQQRLSPVPDFHLS